jgi:D-amino-acid dehydrogenase
MKTLVLGGGVVGVTTAYFLAKAGHDVTILDEKDGLGLEASAGNTGIIAPGHSFAWASPRAAAMLLRSLRGDETTIRTPGPDPHPGHVGTPFPARVPAPAGETNTRIKLRLCQYSQGVLTELPRAERI